MDGWIEWMVIIGRRWSKCTFSAKKWAKKWMEICANKGAGVEGGGPTPNSKCHARFSFVLILLLSPICYVFFYFSSK